MTFNITTRLGEDKEIVNVPIRIPEKKRYNYFFVTVEEMFNYA